MTKRKQKGAGADLLEADLDLSTSDEVLTGWRRGRLGARHRAMGGLRSALQAFRRVSPEQAMSLGSLRSMSSVSRDTQVGRRKGGTKLTFWRGFVVLPVLCVVLHAGEEQQELVAERPRV